MLVLPVAVGSPSDPFDTMVSSQYGLPGDTEKCESQVSLSANCPSWYLEALGVGPHGAPPLFFLGGGGGF